MTRHQTWGAVFALVLALGACRGGPEADPVLRLSAAESLAEGQRLMEAEKYSQARKYLQHAFEVEPNSVSGREALLLVADSLLLEGGRSNLVQAESKYRDFLNRFPTSERADYAQFQIANSLTGRLEKPDRDQEVTRQAVVAFHELLRLFPDSTYGEQAEAKIVELETRLAEHEFLVGHFYYRYGLPAATVSRLEKLLAAYPHYPEKDKVYFFLGAAHRKAGKAEESREWFDKLRQEYPDSPLIAEIPRREAEG